MGREKDKSDGAQTQTSLGLGLGMQLPGKPTHTTHGPSSLQNALDNNAKQAPQCPFHGPRNRLSEWKAMGADPVLLEALRKGVNSPLYGKPSTQPRREVRHLHEIQTITGEYLQRGVLRKLTDAESQRTKTWTPVFGRPKKFSDKVRLITDLRELNRHHQVPKHRPTTWREVLHTISKEHLQWD